jgi:NAD(P)-dependent dehydrogenase (short-subunit alcohol dehydrogenase family)
MRVIVLGASTGLGRCIGVGLAKGGDQVALMARSEDKLAGAAADAGPNAFAMACDVLDEGACKAAIDAAADKLGGVDAFVYSVGVGHLAMLTDTGQADWRRLFDTNVIGAAVATTAILPHLAKTNGTAAYLSSISGSQTLPWPALGAYSVSKAALDKLIDAYRVEHPTLGFTRVVVGDCAGGDGDSVTHFANNFDFELMAQWSDTWMARGYMTGGLLPVEELVRIVTAVLHSDPATNIPVVVAAPRPPA